MLRDRRGLGLGLGPGLSPFVGGIQPFIMSVKTNNAGTSSSTQFKLPLPASGTYNFSVDWGDGTNNTITAYNQTQTTHTYSSAGTYTVKILGVCIGWQFNGGGDCLKLLDVSQYGCLTISTGAAFMGCANLTGTAIDAPKITATDMSSTFWGCSKFNGNLSTWNMSTVTGASGMFFSCSMFNNGGSPGINNWTFAPTSLADMFWGCTVFNQPIGNWNTSNVTSLFEAFTNCIAFNQNIGAWNVGKVTSFQYAFQGCTAFNNGGSADINNWTFNGLSTVNVNTMFANCPAFNQPINWNIKVNNATSTFSGCIKFNQNIGNWDMSACTSIGSMFFQCSLFNNGGSSSINSWSTGNVTSMYATFQQCTVFNQPIGGWDTSKVTDMSVVLYMCYAFNQPIGTWNVSNVTSFGEAFTYCSSFNQNIGAWNVGKVTSFYNAFAGCTAFNNGGSSTISSWTFNGLSTVNVSGMFNGCPAFNQPVNWSIKVSSAQSTFSGCTVFNQNVGNWDMSACTTIGNMFTSCSAFNNGGSSDINSWNTGSVTNMGSTFQQCTVFNQPIGSWNTSNVTYMAVMLYICPAFNQNIGAWNVSKVTNFQEMLSYSTSFNNGGSSTINSWTINTTTAVRMYYMFAGCTAFNQPLNNWNVSKVNNMVAFMDGKTAANYSSANYDAILNSWSALSLTPNVGLGMGSIKYTAAGTAARAVLTSAPNNWTVTDGGI